MKTLALFLAFLLALNLVIISQTNRKKIVSDIKENCDFVYVKEPGADTKSSQTDLTDPVGTVPTLTSYWDYVTNGNNLRRVWVFGDTVIVVADWSDSANAQITTSRRTRYNVSYDLGYTWGTDIIVVNPLGCAYPDASPVITNVGRTVAISGRRFVSGSVGYAAVDLLLGLGVFIESLIPAAGRDYFTSKLSSGLLGGSFLRGDSLFYISYNYMSYSFGAQQIIAAPPTSIDTNSRHYVTASSSGQNVFVMWWVSTEGNVRMMGRESTNGGSSFGASFTIIPYNTVIHGNSISAWFGADLIYKPGTFVKCVAMNTLEVGNYSTAQGSKLVFWSPNINGGNPVNIADWTNLPVMNDTFWFNVNSRNMQVGITPVSHPTLAYSSDGTVLLCVYSSVQSDTSYYGYHYNDIWFSYSYNDGATWSTPLNLTNTPTIDEIYPSISKTDNIIVGGNSLYLNLTYMVSSYPGSASFTNTETPVSKNYHVFRRHNVLISQIGKISAKVPEMFQLFQNYPNPFNPVTKIKFDLPKKSYIKVKTFNVLGEELKELINENLNPGSYEVNWDGTEFPSGVYFYRLEADGFTETKRMILLK